MPGDRARRKRCLVFNPFFPVLGGGERYTVALGAVIAETHEVTYAGPYRPDPAMVERLGFPPIDVQQVTLEEFPGASAAFDLAVVFALEFPPRTFAVRSIAMVQFPRGATSDGTRVQRWVTAAKLRRYHCIVNSEFTREWLRRRWNVDASVVMPPVVLVQSEPMSKDNLILAVGRFMGRAVDDWNSKRQDVLISAFSQLPPHVRDSWHLVLVGGCSPSPEMDDYLDELKRRAAGLNISFEVNVTPERLVDLQRRARLFWHASGFERAADAPETAEHFGIATVEAMSNGAIPMVYADGGQLEIVSPEFGALWRSIPELVSQTTDLSSRSVRELDAMGAAARSASTRFGSRRFETEVRDVMHQIGVDRPLPGRVARSTGTLWRRTRWLCLRALGRTRAMVSRGLGVARRH